MEDRKRACYARGMITPCFDRSLLPIWLRAITATISVVAGGLTADDLVVDSQLDSRWRDATTLEYTRSVDGTPTRFVIDASSGRIKPHSKLPDDRLLPQLVTRSSNGGPPVDLIFKNRTDESLDLFWLDARGASRPYEINRAGSSSDLKPQVPPPQRLWTTNQSRSIVRSQRKNVARHGRKAKRLGEAIRFPPWFVTMISGCAIPTERNAD